MPKGENKTLRRRMANAYLSSVISISLLLVLIGLAALLLVNSGSVSSYFKEHLQVSVLMTQDASEEQAQAYMEEVQKREYVRSARLVSREEGTRDLQNMLGEDFLSVFETSPVPVSVDLSLKAEYVCADSLDKVIPLLSASPIVDEVSCQRSLVDALNANIARISMVLGVFILLMLFISFVLINNTVRISVFARRFTIQTMKLVGATRAFIRRPFVISAVWQGLVSSALAVLCLGLLLLFVRRSFAQLFVIFTWKGLAMVAAVVVVCGLAVCVTSTCLVVNRLVAMHKDELYY